MCGIAGFFVRDPKALTRFNPDTFLDDLLRAVDNRGGDACGFAATGEDGKLRSQRAAVRAAEFARGRRYLPSVPLAVIGHTRMATQGHQGWNDNNHPVSHAGIYVVHNGHIWNDAALIREHAIRRIGEVDSFAIAAMLATVKPGEEGKALERLDGTYAIAVINAARPGELLLARGQTSPLMVYHSAGLYVFASTSLAIQSAWKKAFGKEPGIGSMRYLPEGMIVRVNAEAVTTETFSPQKAFHYQGNQGRAWRPSGDGWQTVDEWKVTQKKAAQPAKPKGKTKPKNASAAANRKRTTARRKTGKTETEPTMAQLVARAKERATLDAEHGPLVNVERCGICNIWEDPADMVAMEDPTDGERYSVCLDCADTDAWQLGLKTVNAHRDLDPTNEIARMVGAARILPALDAGPDGGDDPQ